MRMRKCPVLTCSSWKQVGLKMTWDSRARFLSCSQGLREVEASEQCPPDAASCDSKDESSGSPCSAAAPAAKVGDARPEIPRADGHICQDSIGTTTPYGCMKPFCILARSILQMYSLDFCPPLGTSPASNAARCFFKKNMLPQLNKHHN